MCTRIGVTGNTQGPHTACAVAPSRSPTLSQTARGHRHSPNTVSRCRKICGAHHPRQDVCNRRCNRNLKVTKLPETSHRRSPTLSQTLRCRGHRPTTASRCSRVRRVDLPRQDACKHRLDRLPNVSKLPAPSRRRALTPSQTARASRRSPITVSRWSKICLIDRPRQLVCKRPCVTGYRRSENCPSPSCHHPESNATCAPVRVATCRVDPTATCWPTGALAL